MPLDALDAAPSGAERTRRRDGREDAAARRVQLLVARAAGAQRELADAVAAERRMRVAVDEPRHGAEPGAVELLDLAVERREVAHPPDRLDRLAVAEDVRVLDHVDRAQVGAARRPAAVPAAGVATCARSRRSSARHGQLDASNIGVDRPCSRAAASASG